MMSGWTTAACVLVLCFIAETQADTQSTCELSPYRPIKSARQILAQLQTIVQYCEKKINVMETKKKQLESLMQQTERQNAQFSHEKRKKEKKVKGLNEDISKLQVEVGGLQRRISTTSSHMRHVEQRIVEVEKRIAVTNQRINYLRNSIRGKQGHIDALNRRIARERSKRRCGFGRRRWIRSVPEGKIRVRRGWGRRFVRRVTRVVKKVVRPIITIPKCIVDNLVSRLSRAKEKAERERNNLNHQLILSQREKVIIEGERGKLLSQKGNDAHLLATLNNNLRSMRSELSTATGTKARIENEICVLKERVDHLKKLLQRTDQHLTQLRVTKTKVLSILNQLVIIHSEKVEDLEEVSEAGEDIDDLLEEIKVTNEQIKKSVEHLIRLTCGEAFRQSITHVSTKIHTRSQCHRFS